MAAPQSKGDWCYPKCMFPTPLPDTGNTEQVNNYYRKKCVAEISTQMN